MSNIIERLFGSKQETPVIKEDLGKVTFTEFTKRKDSTKISKSSKQLSEKDLQYSKLHGLVAQPYPPSSLLELYESCEVFFATVNQIAVDTAGLGWKLQLKEGMKENEKEKKRIQEFLQHPNDKNISFRKILKTILQDWGVIGFGVLECVRQANGQLAEIYPLRAFSLWFHEDREKYCQQIGLNKVWFKPFGSEKDFSIKTGEEGEYSDEKAKAGELIIFATQYGRNAYYPIPNILPAVLSASTLREIKSYNYSFFRNYAVPAMSIILTGKWKDKTAETIISFIDEKIRGSENAHKTMVLQAPTGGTIEFNPLAKIGTESGFTGDIRSLEDDILSVYSMPPYRIGKSVEGTLGGTNILEATKIYITSVIEPLQEELENMINYDLFSALECKSYEFKFALIDTRDLDAEIKRYESLIEHGSINPNQIIEKTGIGETYEGGDKFYMKRGLVEVGEMGLEKEDSDKTKLISQVNKLKRLIESRIHGVPSGLSEKDEEDLLHSVEDSEL